MEVTLKTTLVKNELNRVKEPDSLLLHTDHLHSLRVYVIGNNATVLRHVFDKLVECCSFYLLPLEITKWVLNEVKQRHALPQLLHKQSLSLGRRHV